MKVIGYIIRTSVRLIFLPVFISLSYATAEAIWHEPKHVGWLTFVTLRKYPNGKPVFEERPELKPLVERVIFEAANAVFGSRLFEWGGIRGAILPARCPMDPRTLGTQDRWTPDLEDVRQAEADLRPFLRRRTAEAASPEDTDDIEYVRKNLVRYCQQYAGVVRNGRRQILVNAFMGEESRRQDWRLGRYSFCDGGADFWHASYDVETRRFLSFRPNGTG